MDRHTVIIVTDLRQQYIGDYLCGCVRTLNWNDVENQSECLDWIRKANQIVLPTPVSKMQVFNDVSNKLKENLINCNMAFGGKIEEDWRMFFLEHEIEAYDFMEDEAVAQENANITAEAVVAELLKKSMYSIREQKIVVTGYGRCAKAIAKLLQAMGAKITVVARSVYDRKSAKEDGHNAVDFSYAAEEMYGTGTLINTVPAFVITENILSEMHKDAIVIDIASAPGGVDIIAAEKHKIPVVSALSLPAKYTQKSSAKILADVIRRRTPRNNGVREEKSWIFRIII